MEPLKNQFFHKAIGKAAEYLKNKRRLAALFTSASLKLKNVKFERLNGRAFMDKVSVFIRMVKAYVGGNYRSIPWKSLLLILGSIIYFVTPIDMIPDFILISGLLDDFTVILWVYNSLRTEVDAFIEWENMKLQQGTS